MRLHIRLLLIVTITLALSTSAFCGAIYLKSGTVSPSAANEISGSSAAGAVGSGYYIVVFKGPVTENDKAELSQFGAELLEYLPDYAFLVKTDSANISQIRKLDSVEWVGTFRSSYKYTDDVSRINRSSQFLVTLFPGVRPEAAVAVGKLLGAKLVGCVDRPSGGLCRILADGSELAELAKSDTVAWIEPYTQPKLCNDVASEISGVPEVRQNLRLFGEGQIVGVADAGLDTGNADSLSLDFAGRVLKAYSLRRSGDWSDLNGHGTHVVGSVLGSGALSGSNAAVHEYSGSFAGYAPEAKLVFQSIGDSGALVFPPLHLSELFQPVYSDGVRIHSDSWGSAAAGQYTVYSNEVDQFVWDHKDFLPVFAVGNEAEDLNQDGIIDSDSIYAPATAKNCISVGATESLRSSGGYQMGYGVAWASSYPAAPIKYDLMSNNINGMAAFSGRGPTDDNRIKPDICAPGTNIISCRAPSIGPTAFWTVYNANYAYMGGTSMSTPQVAGAAVLVREYYQKEKGTTPSAALIKATLISGAVDMAPGQYGTGTRQEMRAIPNGVEGWGRLNVANAIASDPPTVNEFADESVGLTTGETREYRYSVVNSSVPLKVTLVWTDYPGAVHAAKELVNDLDLTIISPTGQVYPLNAYYDRTNNVEQVLIASPEIGIYSVQVTGYNVPMGPQDYALVVSGGLPSTYISGNVASSSGAGVQGAMISLVSLQGVKRLVTNLNGNFITHVSSGTYSVQVSKPGWTFTPRAQVVSVSDLPVENVNFEGHGTPGQIVGKVTSAIGGVVSRIVESPHPYLNNCNTTYTVTGHSSAGRIRVHFAEIDLMSDGDTIYVMDSDDKIIDTYTGKGEDIWSDWASGNTLNIRLVSNEYGNIGYGFYIDGYETDLIGQGGPEGVKLMLSPGVNTAVSDANGSYDLSSVPPGTYTVTPFKDHWKFQPASKNVEVPAAGTASEVDFLAFPPGSIRGDVQFVSSEVHSTDIESDHPYLSTPEQIWTVEANPDAVRMRLHFSKLVTEPAWDFVYILDGSDNVIEAYTADYADLWTPWIDGSIAKIMLSTDDGNNEYGFKCDKYEAQLLGGGLAGVCIDLSPNSILTFSAADGSFSIGNVDAGSHTVIPSLAMWTFDPSLIQVGISAGIEETLFFYAQLGEITDANAVKFVPDAFKVTLKGLTVCASFDGFFYVEDTKRVGGLRVDYSGHVDEGSRVDIIGKMATIDGERKIIASSVTKTN